MLLFSKDINAILMTDNETNTVNAKLNELLRGVTYHQLILKDINGTQIEQQSYIKKATTTFDNCTSYDIHQGLKPIHLDVVTFTDMEEPIYIEDVVYIDKRLLSTIHKFKRGQLNLKYNERSDIHIVVEKDIGTVCLESI